MANAVIMPRQGQSVESCILTEWYKSVGDSVSKGELLFAYETDKAAFEEEAPEDGILLIRFYEEGDEVPVLLNVAVLGAEGDDFEAFRPEGSAPESTEAVSEAEPTEKEEVTPSSETGSGPQPGSNGSAISPRALKLAKEKRVVMEALTGSGPGGRIIERDVLEAIRQGKVLTPLAQKKKEAEGLTVPCDRPDCGKYKADDLVEPSSHPSSAAPGEGAGSFSDVPLSKVPCIVLFRIQHSLHTTSAPMHLRCCN